MASVYKPSHSKTFRVGFYDNVTGKKKSVSAKTTDRTKANKFAKDFEARLRLKRYESNFEHPQDHRTKLSEAFKVYLEQKDFSKETVRSFTSIVNNFIGVAGDKFLFQFSKFDYRDLINELTRRNASINTKAIYSRHLFALFNWLIAENFVQANPITRLKGQLTDVKPIPLDDLDKLLNHLQAKEEQFIHHYRLIKLTFLCAFRISEAIRSEAADFDIENKIIMIRNHKGKRQDKIPMVKDIADFLKDEFVLPANGRLFNYASRESIKSFWNKLNEDLHFNYTVHQLRKTRGTQLANAGVEPLFLQKFMRHKDFRTTQNYYIKLSLEKMAADINLKLNLNHILNHKTDRDKPRPAKRSHKLASNGLKFVKKQARP